MAALTFHHALAQAEVQARTSLPSELHERLSCAVSLVKDQRVFQASDHTWQVDSVDHAGLTYSVNGACTCKDYQFNKPPRGLCKHRLAVYLSRRAVELMQTPPAPVVPETPEAPVPVPVPALPEAPASVNCHIQIGGRQVQLTLRDSDESRLLARLAVVLEQYPATPAVQAAAAPRAGLVQRPPVHHAL